MNFEFKPGDIVGGFAGHKGIGDYVIGQLQSIEYDSRYETDIANIDRGIKVKRNYRFFWIEVRNLQPVTKIVEILYR